MASHQNYLVIHLKRRGKVTGTKCAKALSGYKRSKIVFSTGWLGTPLEILGEAQSRAAALSH